MKKNAFKTSGGRFWTDHHSEKYFGKSESVGDFFGNGSSGWKLLAFENYLLDISAKISARRLMRISVYDSLLVAGRLISLGQILSLHREEYEAYALKFLKRKIES